MPPSGHEKASATVVGGVDDDRVVGDAEVVELSQELANLAIVLHHAVGIDAEPGLSPELGLRRVQMCMRVGLNQTKNGFPS